MKSIPTLVDALLAALQPHLNLPFIFFGHSMGAVLAFEITQALVLRGQPTPRHLIVSARRPPHIPSDLPDLHPLPNDEFIAEINRRYGGISQELLAERELFDILLPGLRADITALESYRPALRAPLMCAISAFGGVHDRLTPRSHLDEWRSQTTGPFQVRMFPGDHFYLDSCRLALLAHVASLAAPILSSASFRGLFYNQLAQIPRVIASIGAAGRFSVGAVDPTPSSNCWMLARLQPPVPAIRPNSPIETHSRHAHTEFPRQFNDSFFNN